MKLYQLTAKEFAAGEGETKEPLATLSFTQDEFRVWPKLDSQYVEGVAENRKLFFGFTTNYKNIDLTVKFSRNGWSNTTLSKCPATFEVPFWVFDGGKLGESVTFFVESAHSQIGATLVWSQVQLYQLITHKEELLATLAFDQEEVRKWPRLGDENDDLIFELKAPFEKERLQVCFEGNGEPLFTVNKGFEYGSSDVDEEGYFYDGGEEGVVLFNVPCSVFETQTKVVIVVKSLLDTAVSVTLVNPRPKLALENIVFY